MLADEMQTQSNQPGPIQQASAQMPISLLLIMHLMRNHRVGESPNLCKHTVSIDLFRGDMSLLGLARRLLSPTWERHRAVRGFGSSHIHNN